MGGLAKNRPTKENKIIRFYRRYIESNTTKHSKISLDPNPKPSLSTGSQHTGNIPKLAWILTQNLVSVHVPSTLETFQNYPVHAFLRTNLF